MLSSLCGRMKRKFRKMLRKEEDWRRNWESSKGWLMLSLLRPWVWEKKPPACRWDRAYHVICCWFVTLIQTILLNAVYFWLVLLRQHCSGRQLSWRRSWTQLCCWWEDLDYWRHILTQPKTLVSKLQVRTLSFHGFCSYWGVICLYCELLVCSVSVCTWTTSSANTRCCLSCRPALPTSTERQLPKHS